MSDHKPDQFLMRQIVAKLQVEPLSISKLAIALNRLPAEIRQALNDLAHYGKVCVSYDGYRFELAHGGYVPPDPEAA